MQMAMNTMKVQKNCDTCSHIIIKDNYFEYSMCSKNYHIKSHCLDIDKNNLKNYKAGKNSICATCIREIPFNHLNTQDFNDAVNNLATNLTEKDKDRLENLVFNPFKLI